MTVLVFNPGSNSLKFQIIDAIPDAWGRKRIQGAFEPIGRDTTFTVTSGVHIEESFPVESQGDAAGRLIAKLKEGAFEPAGVRQLSDVELIACRVVHGADRFREPVRVDASVLAGVEALDEIAPLHNANSVAILRACLKHPIPIVAVFDSAFHATLPEIAYRYAIDYELSEKHGIRRYGFH